MASEPRPDSLLAVAHSLRSALSPLASNSHSASSQQHHALGQVPPAAIPDLKQRTADSITQLHAGLAALSNLALPSPSSLSASADAASAPTPAPRQPDPRERDKLLTLLRDAALAEQPLLDARTAALSAFSLSHLGDHRARALFPARTPAPHTGARGILDALERVAADLALVHLRDDPAQDGGSDEAGPVVLSLGGKLMAVDVELSDSSAHEQRVERTKVAYVVAGHDAQCPAASDKLHALLAAPSPDADTGTDAAQVQARWRGVRTLLEELKELDEATERTGDDCFARVTRELPDELAQALPSAGDASSGCVLFLLSPSRRRGIDALRAHSSSSTSLRLLPSPSSLHPRLVYHSPPRPLPPSSPTLNDDDGTYTATISLSAIVDAPLAGAAAGSDPARPYVALLSPAVPLSRRTARRVCEALGLGREGAAGGCEEAQGARERDEEEDVEGWVGALLGAQGGLARARTEGNTAVRALPLSRTSRGRADAPLRTDPPRLPAALLHPRPLASLPPSLILHRTLSTRSLARTRTRTAPRRDAPPLRARRAARRRARRPRRPDARQRARAQRRRAARDVG